MAVYNTASGNKLRVDKGNNTFINGKCINPLEDSPVTLLERSMDELAFEDIEPETVQITGHVPNFTYGYGDDEVTVNTGHKAW